MSEAQQGTSSRQAPRRSILLILSLCLNVVLVVMIAVGIANALHQGGPRGGPFAPEALKSSATSDERAKIDAIIAAHAGKISELKQAARAAHQVAFKMFTDANFDPAAFESALGKAQDADDALRREFATVTVQCAAQLSASERQAVAERARKRFMWWRYFGGSRHGHPG